MRPALAILLLGISIYAANAFGLGREGLGFGKLGVASKAGTGGAPPSSCNGAIDLSTGCVMPMLR
jgi:hypothetical protein